MVTYAAELKGMNLVIPTLQDMVDQGAFNESRVYIHKVRLKRTPASLVSLFVSMLLESSSVPL